MNKVFANSKKEDLAEQDILEKARKIEVKSLSVSACGNVYVCMCVCVYTYTSCVFGV